MPQNLNSAVAVIGIDIGKNSFHVVGLDDRGAIVLCQKWSRGQIEARLANLPPCLIGMEACVGAHHLSRKLKAFGHDARLMPAKYVRPYSKGQKNDFRDAEAIAEAVQRPTMRFVATKTAEQLDLYASDWSASGSQCNKSGIGTPFVKTGEFGEERPIIREWTTRPLKLASADYWAMMWAKSRGLTWDTVAAEWTKLGKRAGPLRNAKMLAEYNPECVIAFPGGFGTSDMIRRAERAKVPVIEVKPTR